MSFDGWPEDYRLVTAPFQGGRMGKLTRRRLQRGVFHSLVDLQAAINGFIEQHNATDAKPFRWTADPDQIIAARNCGFQTLASAR